jgi:hypothetical protein
MTGTRTPPPFRVPCAIAALLTGMTAAASVPVEEFGWRFPLSSSERADVHVLTLSPEIYQAIADPDLRDLRVVTASGRELGFGPWRSGDSQRWRDMPWVLQIQGMVFEPMPSVEAGTPAPRAFPSDDGDFGLQLAAGAYPARLSLRLKSTAAEDVPIVSLRISWRAPARLPPTTQWWVSDRISGQLSYPVRSHQRHDAASSRGETRLEFEDLAATGIVLHAMAVPSNLSIEQVLAEYSPDPDRYRHRVELTPAALPGLEPEAQGYLLPGPYPVHAAEFVLTEPGVVATLGLYSRDQRFPHWRHVGTTTAFELQVAQTAMLGNRLRFPVSRHRQWQLRSEPLLAVAPVLRMYYQPDRFVVLNGGDEPFFLLAGHRSAYRPSYPVEPVIIQLRERLGRDWSPPELRIGARETLRGHAALRPPPEPLPYRRWALWALLVVGAAVIASMAVSLLRESRDKTAD